jgi:hypothetical protein
LGGNDIAKRLDDYKAITMGQAIIADPKADVFRFAFQNISKALTLRL